MYSETDIKKLDINVLTKSKYDNLLNSGEINEDGFYLVTDETKLWVEDEIPNGFKDRDVWVDSNNYSRYDVSDVITSGTFIDSDNEVMNISQSSIITLNLGKVAGVVRNIFNNTNDVISVIGADNLMGAPQVPNFYIYPQEYISLITSEDK